MKKPVRGNAITATLLLLVVVASYMASYSVLDASGSSDPGPAAYPRIILVAIGICAILLYFIHDEREDSQPRSWKTIVLVLIAIAAYIALLGWIGYIAATVLFTLSMVLLAGERRILLVILYPIIFSLVLYFVFSNYLNIVLPEGLIEGLM